MQPISELRSLPLSSLAPDEIDRSPCGPSPVSGSDPSTEDYAAGIGATGAVTTRTSAGVTAKDAGPAALQHHLSPVVITLLANVVRRLRSAWLGGPALLWSDVFPIRLLPIPQVDKRVATALASGFAQFSNLLASFEVLLLELEKSGVVSEECLLSLEQLLVQGDHFFGDQIEVSDSEQRFPHVSGQTERSGNDADV